MKETIHVVGEGRLGAALAEVEGATVVGTLDEVSGGAAIVLIEDDSPIAIEQLRSILGPGPALFRVAALVAGPESDQGAVLVCPEEGTSSEAIDVVKDLLRRIGEVEIVTENMLAAAAAVGRMSPGCVSVALEGIEEGAVQAGLSRPAARAFVRQTLLATALLLQDPHGSPADLKDRVASPGGTTIAGLASLEDGAVRGAFIRAVEQAAEARAERTRREQTSRD